MSSSDSTHEAARLHVKEEALRWRPSIVVIVLVVFARRWRDGAVNTMILVIRSGGEEQRVRRLIVEAIAERHAPKTIELQCAMVRAFELTFELASRRVERIDRTVTEIADQDVVGEFPERRRREHDGPWRVQPAATREAAQQVSVGIELVDGAETRACR